MGGEPRPFSRRVPTWRRAPESQPQELRSRTNRWPTVRSLFLTLNSTSVVHSHVHRSGARPNRGIESHGGESGNNVTTLQDFPTIFEDVRSSTVWFEKKKKKKKVLCVDEDDEDDDRRRIL